MKTLYDFESQPPGSPVGQTGQDPPPAVAPFDATQAKVHQQAWADHLGVPVETTNSIGMKFAVIPPGEFMMGSPEDEPGRLNGETLHKVTLTKPFQMGMHEVTQEQYEKVMGNNPSEFKGAQNPVETVSWDDAVEFCRKLSALPAEKSSGYVYRLPTEAGWAYACRAGTKTAYSFGDSKSEQGGYSWFHINSGRTTHPVGGKKPNPWGLYDMHGNVWEWCQDWHGQYPNAALTDPTGPVKGSSRVIRGGSYHDLTSHIRSAFRNYDLPHNRNTNWGFRVVRVATQTPASAVAPSAVAPFDAAQAKAHQQAWADYLGVPVETTNSIGMKLVVIPPGEFMMGSPGNEPRRDDADWKQLGRTLHKVTLTQPFQMGMYEVTQEQYEKVMRMSPSKTKGPQNPVEQVSWDQAVEFCRKLSALPAEKSSGFVYRLPTEAGWAYACRAGTTTAYSFGDSVSELGDYAWYNKNSNHTTHAVGQKKPNPWGLYDMHGNVWEWCRDRQGDYPSSSVTDPNGPASGSYRIYRSGSWDDFDWRCRSAYRFRFTPDTRLTNLGFRIVRVAVPQGPPPAVAPFDATQAKAHQKAWANHLGVPVETTNSIGMKFVVIPPGEFMMGSPKDEPGRLDDETHHKVTLTKPFQMGMHEVTQEQYQKVMGTNPSNFKGPQNPVEQVTWNEAAEFCRKLSAQPEENTAGYAYRLPTEAEWEYACRAGTESVRSCGDELSPDHAWFGDNSGDRQIDAARIHQTDNANYVRRLADNNCRSRQVGQKIPNAFGLYDMHGNVWELCEDWYGDYPGGSVTDPAGALSGSNRVQRGGSWHYKAVYLRSARRSSIAADHRDDGGVGFRVVRVSVGQAPPPAVAPFDATQAKAHQQAWADYLGVPVETTNSIGMKFVVIPPGEFMMGEDSGHQVTLTKPFQLGMYEVTQEQYQRVMGTNPSQFKRSQNPVEMVSPNDAVDFCRKLSDQTQERVAGYVYRLPTEAEWEYACRTGTVTKYSFGDSDAQLGDYAWYSTNSGSATHPVGTKKPNPWGLYDMHSNVYESCQDWYGDYPSGAVTDPTGPSSGSDRAVRGGGWLHNSDYCRSAYRSGSTPDGRFNRIGFRVLRSSVK